jgi:hypothetical protein
LRSAARFSWHLTPRFARAIERTLGGVHPLETELERLRDLASLEGFARLDDLEALLSLTRFAPDALKPRLLEGAKRIFEARTAHDFDELEPHSLSDRLEILLRLVERPGLNTTPFTAVESSMTLILTSLEDLHRDGIREPLEATAFAALEVAKAALFGRGLNIAERSRLRGIYERTKLLRSW